MNLHQFFVGRAIGFLVVVVLAGSGYWLYSSLHNAPPLEEGVACTADAMQCPDGSYVGRSGPHCEFICPTASSTADGTPTGTGSSGGGFAEYHSGIKGTVMAGPTCPVMRNPPDPACADKSVVTNVWISRKSAPQQVMATTQSDKKGMFQTSLPPGEYVIQAGSSGVPFPRCTDASAIVGPSGYTDVTVSCDTGIR